MLSVRVPLSHLGFRETIWKAASPSLGPHLWSQRNGREMP